jgi:hypothetical protein
MAALPQVIMQEKGFCFGCNSEIHQENIEIKRVGGFVNRQHILAYCAHCKKLVEFARELRGGVWQRVTGVEEVTEPARIERFLKRTAEQRNEVQVG